MQNSSIMSLTSTPVTSSQSSILNVRTTLQPTSMVMDTHSHRTQMSTHWQRTVSISSHALTLKLMPSILTEIVVPGTLTPLHGVERTILTVFLHNPSAAPVEEESGPSHRSGNLISITIKQTSTLPILSPHTTNTIKT